MRKEMALELKFSSDPKKLRMVRERVQDACEDWGCSKKTISDVVIAVNEACMNIIQHAYKGEHSGSILLEIEVLHDCLAIEITDYAEPVDTEQIKPRALDDIKPGGLGTHFIQEIMDEINYEHLSDRSGNRLKMIKKMDGN
jgi:sigma-B regulation protein RsbU (phosphoserine phosphatase)